MVWIQFIAAAAVIVYAGSRLTVDADIVSDRLQLGKVWIGVILLGMVTSLPEAVATLYAMTVLKANDLAAGNIFGSNNFNPLLIVLADFFYKQGAVTDLITFTRAHRLSAGFAVLLTLLAMAEIYLSPRVRIPLAGSLSLGSLVIAAVFFVGMKLLSTAETPAFAGAGGEVQDPMSRVYLRLVFHAALVVAGAMWLTDSAETIARITGWGETFVGSMLLAMSTSLPEMVVTITALRMGSFDLAVGNIFGSNMVNIFILVLCDAVYPAGSLFASISPTHLVTGTLSILLTAVVVIGFKTSHKKTFCRLGWDSWFLIFFFISGAALLYHLK